MRVGSDGASPKAQDGPRGKRRLGGHNRHGQARGLPNAIVLLGPTPGGGFAANAGVGGGMYVFDLSHKTSQKNISLCMYISSNYGLDWRRADY